MWVRLLAGSRAGTMADIPLPNARVMLADGRAALPNPETPADLGDVEASPVARRDDRRAVGLAQRRRR